MGIVAKKLKLVTHAEDSCVDKAFSGIYVCLFFCFPHNVSKTYAARITKLDRNVPP